MNALDERLHHGLDRKINLWVCILCLFFCLFRIFERVFFLSVFFVRVFNARVFFARVIFARVFFVCV